MIYRIVRIGLFNNKDTFEKYLFPYFDNKDSIDCYINRCNAALAENFKYKKKYRKGHTLKKTAIKDLFERGIYEAEEVK